MNSTAYTELEVLEHLGAGLYELTLKMRSLSSQWSHPRQGNEQTGTPP